MAKVFCHILTNNFNLESLPWDDNPSGLHQVPSDIFMMESHQAFTNAGDPLAPKKMHLMSIGSPDLFSSVVEQTPWPAAADDGDMFEGSSTINGVKIPLLQVITGVQQMLKTHNYKFFYPNDLTIITRHPDDVMYLVIRFAAEEDNTLTITIQHKCGSVILFSAFVQMVQDLVNSFS